MQNRVLIGIMSVVLTAAATGFAGSGGEYVVVVSRATHEDAGWKRVVDALVAKHGASVVSYEADVTEATAALSETMPQYTAFVATPAEAGRKFVAQVHQLTRGLDDDPYADTLWGILTGYDAANALEIAHHSEPLTVRKVASGTEIAMEMVEEGKWYCELVKGKWVEKKKGGAAEVRQGPADSTQALVDALNEYQADLFVTSGHATERDWQIGYRYRNGYFKSDDGQMYGENVDGKRIEIDSPNPKVYLPIGNCLMGHIDGKDAMALAWMNDVGVKQMIGYTVPTWFGYAGWGCLDYFVEQPGRYTFTEAFFANQHALIYNLEHGIGNERGMKFDRDVVAYYGDPAWVAKMAERPCYYEQELTVADGVYTLTITPKRGAESFKPVNTNGSQRGWRPMVAFLPHRVKDVELIEGGDLKPLIADDFVLVPNPRECEPGKVYIIRFKATLVEKTPKVSQR